MEVVDSMEDLKSSRSVACKDFPNLEMLDAKIAFVLNKIIPKSHLKKKVGLEEQKDHKEDRFLQGKQIAFMIHDCNLQRDGTKFFLSDQNFHRMLL